MLVNWKAVQFGLFRVTKPRTIPSGCLDLRSTASRRQDNASLRWNNVAFGHYNFHCPSGQFVIISHYDTCIWNLGALRGVIFVSSSLNWVLAPNMTSKGALSQKRFQIHSTKSPWRQPEMIRLPWKLLCNFMKISWNLVIFMQSRRSING